MNRFGWLSLTVWATLGLALEAAHGFKLSSYLDDDLRRQLLRLGHAHGVLLSLVVIVHSLVFPAHAAVRRWLQAAAVLMPLGFVASAWRPSETDPGWPVFLVPLGGLALLVGLGRSAREAFRR